MISKTYSVSDDQSINNDDDGKPTTTSLQDAEVSFEAILPSAKSNDEESSKCLTTTKCDTDDVEMGSSTSDNNESKNYNNITSVRNRKPSSSDNIESKDVRTEGCKLDFDKMVKRRSLPNDTLSMLMFTASHESRTCACIVFLMQKILYAFVLIGIFAHHDYASSCPVHFEHVGSQFLTIIIALITQTEIRTTLNQWNDGYNDNVFIDFYGVAQWKWLLTSILRLTNGFTQLSVSLFMILRSDSVVDMLLNFLAVEVISNFDRAVFIVATEGYFSEAVQKDAFMISSFTYYVDHKTRKSKRLNVSIMLILWVAMTTTWGFYVYDKRLCDHGP